MESVYIDALVLRDRSAVGSLNERMYAMQDANWNTVAIADTSGVVKERYDYTPFGVVSYMNTSWNPLAASAYGWVYLFQGGRLDPKVGLTSFRYRDLMMMLGRWVSTDPIGYQASVNLYCFVANSAITGFDPYGLEPKKSTKKFAGGSADFVYDVYDKKNSTFAFMIGHVSTQFPATGDLKMIKEESDLRAEEAK